MDPFINMFGLGELRQAPSRTAPALDDLAVETARQVPGSHAGAFHLGKKGSQSIESNGITSKSPNQFATKSLWLLLPGLLKNLAPVMTLTLAADLAWITCLFFAGCEITARSLNWVMLAFYLLIYLLSADHAHLYGNRGSRDVGPQIVLAKVLLLTTLLVAIAIECAPQSVTLLPLLVWSTTNWLVLSARRQIWRSFATAPFNKRRNVMIIGNSSLGGSVADALRRDPESPRTVREFILDRSLREPLGVAMMNRIARRECIDEVIVATPDPVVIEAAIREAKRNRWDAFVVPDLQGATSLGFESADGLPMLKVQEQKFPENALALKRIADVVLSSAGLLALGPLLLLIAIVVKLESPGPALYRAVRIGRRAARFKCCKFRTMVPQADQMKNELRSRNQRVGAFFKIQDDPRVTRFGCFLRRYSLDELPQLWNVLMGDMSLVGPRPHPADDVERYNVEDLRRLDFVPGMTGLWQVTARQDPSFKRCVALDVEYIAHWNVMLDMKILCRTITAILQGSGA
jgi:exopolysaccharide biosynthesis polyprenyl glycosylphosphotransferase